MNKSGFQGPGMSWVAPFLVILRVLEVQRAAVVRWLLQEVKGQRPAACSAPQGTSQECSGRPDGVTSVLTVTPDHVMSLSAPPGVRPSVAGMYVHPYRRPDWSPIRAQRHRSPLHHRPHRPALARALEASATPRSCRLPLLAPACASNSLPPSSFTLPCPPRLVWSRQCP